MYSPTKSSLAAPHTPIASSKRLKTTTPKLSIKSPQVSLNRHYLAATPEHHEYHVDSETGELARKNSARSHRIVEPETPSKNLFSPSLRSDSNDHPSHKRSESGDREYHLHSVTNDHYKLDLDNTHSESPAEEIKQHTADDSVDMEEEDPDIFNPYHFIAHLPDHSSVVIRDKLCLPPATSSLATLVLDLDETLVHCTVEPIPKPDLIFPVEFNGTLYQVYVKKRPYLDYFLESISKSFEVVLFTASQKVYADVLLDKLDPQRKYIDHRLFRESCLHVQGNYLKDLTVLGRDLRRTVLVDNSPHAYAYHLHNGIPIESWYDDDSDTELLKLLGFLKKIHVLDDFRPFVRDHFKSYQLVQKARKGVPVPLTAPPF
mmetsp:Transcript_4223/g.4647  ORF Transcript_4223/g.4647 Transcript_4223/m.4647 type:complete len:374 (+) Transcript_4223:280-1401(+)